MEVSDLGPLVGGEGSGADPDPSIQAVQESRLFVWSLQSGPEPKLSCSYLGR